MARSIARLRYRPPPVPISFKRIDAADARCAPALEQRAAAYVVRQSNPRHLRLRTVVDARSKRQPPPSPRKRPVRPPPPPFTLRRLADPHGTARHGQIVYVFCHTLTRQIVYSLQELLDQRHLKQLPFLGNNSKPPALRPDHWAPHCVVTFPTPEQGHNAFRRLRELRRLHELSWEKTNAAHKRAPRALRMKKIMDQQANMSADLAAVLQAQRKQGRYMAGAAKVHEKKVQALQQVVSEQAALAKDKGKPQKKTPRVETLPQEAAPRQQRLAQKLALQRLLKNKPPVPYTLDGVRIQWKDMRHALFAAQKWPGPIEHETLEVNRWRQESIVVSPDDFDTDADQEINNLIAGLRSKAISQTVAEEYEPPPDEPAPQPEKRTGISKYIPRLRLPWRNAAA